ncbi:hypothetical protein ND861_08685 [Leptospira sp. 2 VSF19]|uniref:Lipoprotein n=1 Tax=Leptospira soteropolitanensis TaxID=2950025 RepID=A0AAW5VFK5_9LEPT|nr:hypothetical protein [Leptospira soteropolitanensis]MCW7492723.1 hypothetical protein [Leptospira soteropolitanensis]MCW7500406.1 hypothetical protein [Leptospira soteropolitanensis]MCW7522559.1 hypothetical protein [Leptospira soteropolitanensis]MCW7526415.1 hypothetical protein [Leptospira soteropolitanensis]MCW7530376.1 hypothetical protein [Leptospira soteropolitanensis]
MIRFVFLLFLAFLSCAQLSREDQFREECDKTRNRSYVFMLPILERHSTTGNVELNTAVWIGNTELAYKKCISESEKNRYNLRSN